jgi:outer membrane protein assembly factor BamB
MRTRVFRCVSFPLASVFFAGLTAFSMPLEAAATAAPWSMVGGAPQHRSLSTFRGPDTDTLAWRVSTNSAIPEGPAVDVDGAVFLGTLNGRLFGIEPDGKQRWSVNAPNAFVGVPALGNDGRVYAGTVGGNVYAVDVASGVVAWNKKLGSPVTAGLVINGADGTIYASTQSKGIFALTPTGTIAWSTATGPIRGSAPAVGADGSLFVGTSDGRLVAVNADGSLRWSRTLARKTVTLGTAVIGSATRLYVGASDGQLRAVELADGVVAWAYPAGSALGGVSSGPDGHIIFGAQDGRVRSLADEGATPLLVWEKLLGSPISSTPAIDRIGTTFIGADDGRVHALEADDGATRWTFATGAAVRAALAIGVGGRVLVGSNDRSLYAIGEFRAGEDCWSDAFLDPTGLSEAEADRRFQILIAACGGPEVDSCLAAVQGQVNADRLAAAYAIVEEQIDTAEYLALIRDRTRKLAALRADGELCDAAFRDADGDLVPDSRDQCPETPPLTPTNDFGCPDLTLPDAPSGELVHQFLDYFGFAFDPKCDATVPVVPVPVHATVLLASATNLVGNAISVAQSDNQAPECGVWYEFEVFYRDENGVFESFYLVVPRTRGFALPNDSRLHFTFGANEPDPYGRFGRSTALLFSQVAANNIGDTWIRVRATNFAGVRSVWSGMVRTKPGSHDLFP